MKLNQFLSVYIFSGPKKAAAKCLQQSYKLEIEKKCAGEEEDVEDKYKEEGEEEKREGE